MIINDGCHHKTSRMYMDIYTQLYIYINIDGGVKTGLRDEEGKKIIRSDIVDLARRKKKQKR